MEEWKEKNYKAAPQGKCRIYASTHTYAHAHTHTHTHTQEGFKGILLLLNNPSLTTFMLSLFNFSFIFSCETQRDAACPNTTVGLRLKKLSFSNGGPLLTTSASLQQQPKHEMIARFVATHSRISHYSNPPHKSGCSGPTCRLQHLRFPKHRLPEGVSIVSRPFVVSATSTTFIVQKHLPVMENCPFLDMHQTKATER